MKRSRFAWVAAVVASLAAASLAATTDASASRGTTVTPANQTAGTVQVRFAVKKFVVRGKSLVATGDVIGTYAAADGTQHVTRTPFATRVKTVKARSSSARQLQQATRICDILNLNLAPLRLELLGLIIELDRVVLTIKADSEGGLLGGLLCGLAGGGLTSLPLPTAAAQLTKAARTSGLAAGPGFQVPVTPVTTSATRQLQQLGPVPPGHCTILDLVLGPLDLNLLGLMVHLDRTQLRITANPTGGLLGSLLCGLLGGTPATPVTPVVPSTG